MQGARWRKWSVAGAAFVCMAFGLFAGSTAAASATGEDGTISVRLVEEPSAALVALDFENDALLPLDVSVTVDGAAVELANTPFGRAVALAGADLPATVVIYGAVGTEFRMVATYFDPQGEVVAVAPARATIEATPSPTPTPTATPTPTGPPTDTEPSAEPTPSPSSDQTAAPEPALTLAPTPTPAETADAAPAVAVTGGVPAWWLLGAGLVAVGAGAIVTVIVRKRVNA